MGSHLKSIWEYNVYIYEKVYPESAHSVCEVGLQDLLLVIFDIIAKNCCCIFRSIGG